MVALVLSFVGIRGYKRPRVAKIGRSSTEPIARKIHMHVMSYVVIEVDHIVIYISGYLVDDIALWFSRKFDRRRSILMATPIMFTCLETVSHVTICIATRPGFKMAAVIFAQF